jgi:hypothetical protein
MSEGHLLKPSLARSSKWQETDGNDFDRWVYCMLVACVDSWGMMPADGITLKAALDPFGGAHDAKEFEEAVARLSRCGLVAGFPHQGAGWLYLVGHDEQQARGIHKRKQNPSVPRPEWVLTWSGGVVPATSCGLPATGCGLPSARAEVEVELEVEVEKELEVEHEGKSRKDVSPKRERQYERTPPPKKPDDSDMVELRDHFVKVWGDGTCSVAPAGDLAARAREALRTFGVDKCKLAIDGQRKLAKKSNLDNWKGLRFVFPELHDKGKKQSNKCDLGKVEEFILAANPPKKEWDGEAIAYAARQ